MQTRGSVVTYHHAFGLYLEATRPIPGLVASSRAGVADVQVFLEGMPPWLEDVSAAAESVWYVSPQNDERGEPVLRVWKLLEGTYYRLLYGDGTQFLLDRSGGRVWAS